MFFYSPQLKFNEKLSPILPRVKSLVVFFCHVELILENSFLNFRKLNSFEFHSFGFGHHGLQEGVDSGCARCG